MALSLDPEVAAGLAPLDALAEGETPPAPGDWRTRRAGSAATFALIASQIGPVAGVTSADHVATAPDGAQVPLRWYAPEGPDVAAHAGPGVLYLHGGGMILGSVEQYDQLIRWFVAESGVPALAVDYRLAPEHPHPVPVEDCYAGLVWLTEHAAELGVDPARIAVMGDSAGGGLAAGVALLARDRGGPALARQILIYPMLDDRTTTPDPALRPFLTWTYDDNVTGWGALLGADAGTDAVPPYAAPGRADDVSGLPPTYVDVGALDIFRDEDVEYARRIADTGTPVELHVHPGAPHGFEAFAWDADVSRRARADRVRVLRSL
jgi:acetyl esterase/lipase